MASIKDPLYGHIDIGEVARDLLDTAPVQRLRHVKQTGVSNLVFPSANHTRFEHSLGVYYLADKLLSHLDIQGIDAREVRAAALLHELGHGPYSHDLEGFTDLLPPPQLSDIEEQLGDDPIREVLYQHDLDLSTVAGLIVGEGKPSAIIFGELGVNRADRLSRDAYHMAFPDRAIDIDGFVRSLVFENDELVLAEENKQAAVPFTTARIRMYQTYNHPTFRIARAMRRRAIKRLLATNEVTISEFRCMDDYTLCTELRSRPETRELASRLTDRELYKRGVWVGIDDVPSPIIDAEENEIRSLEEDIASIADAPPEEVIIDVPPRPLIPRRSTKVLVNGGVRRLEEVSTASASLARVPYEYWRLGVYAPADVIGAVGAASERVLELDIDGSLVNESGSRSSHALSDSREEDRG